MAQLKEIKIVKGKILVETGLHIGANAKGVGIGELDNPVLKDVRTGFPYIPGSSLKGKIRSLLELEHGISSNDKSKPCSCGKCPVCKVFGTTAKESNEITRVLFRDAFLSEESKKELYDKNLQATEEKTENMINRLGGHAESPRTMERVIPGLTFDFEIALRVFDNDNNVAIDLLKKGLLMLQKDALGGSVSRGYGKIRFENVSINGQPFKLE
ncbi:MAG TPA: type III-A CRISPR-associated RAMP protein Csm3 [Spirochaetota bacterium]|nr:type III-A CRISPR-associated RAMP protein Csm3 [Spirochaetota bacterium]HOF14612.1 type III-A CRISPR-associated RAMP protein Csm3 [Spirochaetota bacterium]HOM87524.1 type III-A CRISPR-associated RAMP protein Csm3 [Spirochaetota bacterium]HOR93846.1 type III-A CRISPR-associated RAMP protein Csm3 [Spirochaetota bacterium]HOT19585.1 type III-A CRISPR-associated RAMP protein Csm3 [Spirochaetota bacterium]